MSMKLYFAPGACSFVPHSLLETAGASFEPVLVKLHRGEQNEAAFRAVNPRGQVPRSSSTSTRNFRGSRSSLATRWRAPACWRRWRG